MPPEETQSTETPSEPTPETQPTPPVPEQTPEAPQPATPTAQIPPSEPLPSEQPTATNPSPSPEPTQTTSASQPISTFQNIRALADKARAIIQFRKRKKLDHVLDLFTTKSQITNDEVEKLLHVSDATATRYLSQLEKEGKIKQVGITGHAVKYQKI